MSEYKQVTQTVDVPMDAGVEGFILALRGILVLSRVTEVLIQDKGKVTFKRWVREEEEANVELRMDFESVTPIGVIRNNDIVDVGLVEPGETPAEAVVRLMLSADRDSLAPSAFVVSTNSVFFDWFSGALKGKSHIGAERLFGLRLYRDRFVDDDMLLLCASYGPGSSLIDTRVTYRLMLPPREAPVHHGEDNEAIGSGGESGFDRRGEAVRAPEMGSAGSRPGGTVAKLPHALPGRAGPGNRKGNA